MTTIFHEYIKKIRITPQETLIKQKSECLAEIRQSLLSDQKQPVNTRAINSTKYSSMESTPRIFGSKPQEITPLQMAIQYTSDSLCQSQEKQACLQEVIKLYLEYSDLTVPGEYGHALIYAAMYSGCGTEVIKNIITKNPELVSTMSTDGSYPLNIAACYDKQGDCIEVLLKEGKADPNTKTRSDGWTPLHQAVYSINKAGVCLLMQYGANKDETDTHGRKATELKHSYSSGIAAREHLRLSEQDYFAAKAEMDAKKRIYDPIHQEIIEFIKQFRSEEKDRLDMLSPKEIVVVQGVDATGRSQQSMPTTSNEHLNDLIRKLHFLPSEEQMSKLRDLNQEKLAQQNDLINIEPLPALLSRLQSLRKKRDLFKQGPAWHAANDLINSIEHAVIDHLIVPESSQIEPFKDHCTNAIAKAKVSELANHRGWKEALENIALIVLSFGILALPVIATRLCTGNWFFKSKTDSIEQVEELHETIKKIS
ncbi:ankyrin repeat domain-containing protein [Legionella bononiensis]|uniref:Ankyrin repeat domain-containing protein n=1 Tax=Legionella bononiensis TaxID=2793102 RepID=A0ABS1W972_9GAMM|nr:ankyrin repeat domain-containing protein [Legionella bononiensis]MBL7480914.1 ankyrin repeat domain-containing protein [Legionella bononiensis]MBL7525904.1 ankyrin repeat domain-containing protein [Legionella bononiensis]MBL7564029.1 ankyrin repeat domain-containing protein [Legionella bononiensis]